MDTEDLKLFLNLADTLHFGKTSATCHMSPSTLSRQIQKIENEVGQKLFERDNRSVSLTESGLKFKQYARENVDRWNDFHQLINKESQDLKGEISMYCSVTASYSVLSNLLPELRKKHSKIEIKLRTGDDASAIEKVINGEVDIVIAAKPDKLPDKLEFITVTESPLIFISPKVNCYVRDLLSLSNPDWNRIPMILPERGVARKRADHWFKTMGTKPNIYAQVSGNEGIVSMVNLGFGVGVVPQIVLENSPIADEIEILSISNPLKPYHVGICTIKKKIKNPLINAFWNIVQGR